MKITAITCTFERPAALKLCERYMDRQTCQPDQWLILDGPEPMRDKFLDAIENKVTGDAVVTMEDDDFYQPGWIEWCAASLEKFDLVGEGLAVYYNVRRRWWSNCRNTRHASLCQTAFTRAMFEPLANVIRAFDNPFFDCRLWRINCSKMLHLPTDKYRLVIGMKGLPGKAGYSPEHRQISPKDVHQDPSLHKLFKLIGNDAADYAQFYKR